MLQIVPAALPEVLLILATALATHYFMSFMQTLMHRVLGHQPIGVAFFRNHLNFHHTYYCKNHLVSQIYQGNKGNNTPYFLIPVCLIGTFAFFILPLYLFVTLSTACATSFYMHVVLDKKYHVAGSRLRRYAWFRRKQELHFIHHRHANCNFAVIDFFWDRLLGTYRASAAEPRSRRVTRDLRHS